MVTAMTMAIVTDIIAVLMGMAIMIMDTPIGVMVTMTGDTLIQGQGTDPGIGVEIRRQEELPETK